MRQEEEEEVVEEFADAWLTSNSISTLLPEKADKRTCSWLLFKDAAVAAAEAAAAAAGAGLSPRS